MAPLDTSAQCTLDLWRRVRAAKPLVQCITNFVSMDIMANVLLAAGCSPAMAHSLDEVEEFIGIAQGLLVNMGTLESSWVAAKKLAANKAGELGKPWVMDPVGCGATTFRTAACLAMLKCKPAVVRGNASEIMALAGAAGASIKGVDSTAASHDALESAKRLAREHKCIVAVSGAVDLVTDGNRVLGVHNGVELLTSITAAGCAVTSLIAGFVAVEQNDPLLATAHALAVFGLAAEVALKRSQIEGPGSLRVGLLDYLHLLGQKDLEQELLEGIRITEEGHQ